MKCFLLSFQAHHNIQAKLSVFMTYQQLNSINFIFFSNAGSNFLNELGLASFFFFISVLGQNILKMKLWSDHLKAVESFLYRSNLKIVSAF